MNDHIEAEINGWFIFMSALIESLQSHLRHFKEQMGLKIKLENYSSDESFSWKHLLNVSTRWNINAEVKTVTQALAEFCWNFWQFRQALKIF